MGSEIDIYDFSKKTAYHNVGLAVEDKIFWVAKGVLAMFSPVFKNMFYGRFEESEKDIIPLPDKKADEILLLLQFLLNAEPRDPDDTNVKILMKFADEYKMRRLMKECEEFLISKMLKPDFKPADSLELFVIGFQYKMKSLARVTFRMVQSLSKEQLEPFLKDFPPKVRSALAEPIPESKFDHDMVPVDSDDESSGDDFSTSFYGLAPSRKNAVQRCRRCNRKIRNVLLFGENCDTCANCNSMDPRTGREIIGSCYCISEAAIKDLEEAGLW